MPIVTIYQPDHSVLRQPAAKVPLPLDAKFKQLAQTLKEELLSLPNSVGLAATQLGWPYQMFAMQIPEDVVKVRGDVTELLPPTVLINPLYRPLSDEKILGWEGCFSVPDKMGEVWRYKSVFYSGFTPEGEEIQGEAHGLMARIIQHETGHLNGELFVDLITTDARYGDIEEMRAIRRAELAAALNV